MVMSALESKEAGEVGGGGSVAILYRVVRGGLW